MSVTLNRLGWLAPFMAGVIASDAPEPEAGLNRMAQAPPAPKPVEPDGPAPFRGGNVAILVGLMLLPLVVGAGLATDPAVTGAVRASVAPAAPSVAHPL